MMETGFVFSSPWEMINPLKRSSLWRNQYQYQRRPIVHEMGYTFVDLSVNCGERATHGEGCPQPPPPPTKHNYPPRMKMFLKHMSLQSYFEGGVQVLTWLAMTDKRTPADMDFASDTETYCVWILKLIHRHTGWNGNLVPIEERAWGLSQCRMFYQLPDWFLNWLSCWWRPGGIWGMCEIQNTF